MLRYREDIRSIVFVVAFFCLLGLLYFLLPLNVITIASGIIGLSFLSFSCAVITHNTVHVPVFHSQPLNRIFQVALTLAYGHPVSTFVPGHNLSHHLHTQTPKDLMRTSKLRFRYNLLNQLFFGWVVGPPILQANIAYAKAMRLRRPRWFRQLIIETVFYVSFLLILLALDWQKFLFYILIPHQFAAWAIMGINFVQHDGCDPNHPYNHSRNLTGPIINWICFNNGYHGLHHIKPGLHWSLLPKVHAAEVRPHVHPQLEQPSLLTYSWKAYIWPGTRIDYLGRPMVLPSPVPDEPWIPAPEEHGDRASLGAMN